MPTPIKWGPEFLVNTETADDQYDPDVAALADGSFVVVWGDYSQAAGDTTDWAIRAQRYDADGQKLGDDLVINTTTADAQFKPAVAALDDGRYVVAWEDRSNTLGDTAPWAIHAQVMNADGTRDGAEFLVNTTTAGDQDEVTVSGLADGGFAIGWTDYSQSGGDPTNGAARAQLYAADGTPVGGEFLVNTQTNMFQGTPSAAGLDDGRVVIVYQDDSGLGGDGVPAAVKATVYNPDGTVSVPEFLVNTTTAGSQSDARVAALADGRFVVMWEDGSAGGALVFVDVRGQVFNADGSPSGSEFVVPTTLANGQLDPAVTGLADGRFVAVWRDDSASGGDTSSQAVRGQVFNLDGSRDGAEFLVNTTTFMQQYEPRVAALADGRFVVVFSDASSSPDDPFGNAVRGQVFDPRGAAVQLEGTLLGDRWVGTGWGDRMAGSFGDDRLAGGAGDDRIEGEEDNDALFGNAGRDRLFGGTGNDSLEGGSGHDRLRGDEGDDALDGGSGLDVLIGGLGDDLYRLDRTGDRVIEAAGEGTDTVSSSVFDLDLAAYANVENAALIGDAALDATGTAAANALGGNDAANRLTGLGGKDRMTGGLGADLFVFTDAADSATGKKRDVIGDFAQGDDLVDLAAIDAKKGAGNQAFSFIDDDAFAGRKGELRYEQSATKTIVQGDIDGDGKADFEIEFTGVIGFVAGDFIL